MEECPTDSMEFYTNEWAVKYWRELYNKYIVLNDETCNYIEMQYKNVFKGEEKILGCILRGTDYVERRANKHPVQPLPEELIEEAENVMQKFQYHKLFLATEDERILEKFKRVFGEKLLYVDQQRYDNGTVPLALQEQFAKKTNRRMEGMNYLSAIYLLAKCRALIGGRCGMTTISFLISTGYEYVHLWNVGRYRMDDYMLPPKYLPS